MNKIQTLLIFCETLVENLTPTRSINVDLKLSQSEQVISDLLKVDFFRHVEIRQDDRPITTEVSALNIPGAIRINSLHVNAVMMIKTNQEIINWDVFMILRCRVVEYGNR
jgi:hypothetical protein